MHRLLSWLLLALSCSAQSARFVDEHTQAVAKNPAGVKLMIETMDERKSYRLSDEIRLKLVFTSQKERVYTIDTASGGSASATATDFVIEGPGLDTPTHSLPINPRAIVCCDSRRHYVGNSPVSISDQGINLKRLGSYGNGWTLPPIQRFGLKPGEYAIFAQTRNIMRGWPKSSHDAFHALSDIVVTSSNVLYLTIVSDAP